MHCPHARDPRTPRSQMAPTGQRKLESSKGRLKAALRLKLELWQYIHARAGAPSTPPRGLEKEYSARITRSIENGNNVTPHTYFDAAVLSGVDWPSRSSAIQCQPAPWLTGNRLPPASGERGPARIPRRS